MRGRGSNARATPTTTYRSASRRITSHGVTLLKIRLSAGAGSGPTKLAAFDTALRRAGVANYNLIRLSSIIPPGTCITVSDSPWRHDGGEWGDRLYLVYAEMRVDEPGKQAWAGVGWSQDGETGRGLFVEHAGHSEQDVREDIRESLEAMVREREEEFGLIHMRVVGIDCEDQPVCAFVAAVYRSEPWTPHCLSRSSVSAWMTGSTPPSVDSAS